MVLGGLEPLDPDPDGSATPPRKSKPRILGATSLKSLATPPVGSVDYFDDATPGLSLRVTATGVRTWTFFYRDQHRRQKRLSLGRYSAVSLADARELAREALLKVAKGRDPVREKQAARDVLTYGELAQRYIDDHAKPNKRSWAEDERQLASSLLPKWKNRPAGEITAEELLAILNAKVRAGAPVAANRLRALVSRMYSIAGDQRLVAPTANPVIGVKKPTKETTRDRVLSDDEIRRLWQACETQNPYVCAWFRLRLVTAQRGGELLQMRWADIDPNSHFWTIPAAYVKNALGHRVYLNETARELLESVPRADGAVWVFPKSVMGDYKHVGRRLAQGTRANIVAAPKVKGKARAKADIRGHDLRRTAASLMASGGVPRFVISRILNHSDEKDITSIYDRYTYDAEKRAAMEFWGRQLAAVLDIRRASRPSIRRAWPRVRLENGHIRHVLGRNLRSTMMPVSAADASRGISADRKPVLGQISQLEIVRGSGTTHFRRHPTRIDCVAQHIWPPPGNRVRERCDVELALGIRSGRVPLPLDPIDVAQRASTATMHAAAEVDQSSRTLD